MQTLNKNQNQKITDVERVLRRKYPNHSDEEISQMARQRCLEQTWFCSNRTRQVESAKKFLHQAAGEGIDVFNLDDLREHLVAEGLSKAESNNGIGDLVGRKGLYLEAQKIAGKKLYRVPSIDLCSEWYEGKEQFLPKSYYTPSYLEELVIAEAGKKDRRFYEHFIVLLESEEAAND